MLTAIATLMLLLSCFCLLFLSVFGIALLKPVSLVFIEVYDLGWNLNSMKLSQMLKSSFPDPRFHDLAYEPDGLAGNKWLLLLAQGFT